MIIKQIELENIRSFKSVKINLQKGINFFSGDIGSGKSSILMAIEFAFFATKRKDLEYFEILRKGKTKGFVKLVLKDNEKTFEIFRKIKKNNQGKISQTEGHIKINGKILELSPTELTSYIFNFLNFPKEMLQENKNLIFRFTTYIPQNQLKKILLMPIETRLEIIRKIFKIDKYKKIKNAITIFSQNIKENKNFLQGKIETLKTKVKNYVELEKQIKENEKNLHKHLEKKQEQENYRKNFEEAKKKLNNKINDLNSKIIIFEKKISKINEIKNRITEAENSLLKKQDEFKKLNLNYEKEIEKEKLNLLQKKELIGKIENKKVILEKQINEIEKNMDNLNKIENLKDRKKILEESDKELFLKCKINDLKHIINSNFSNIETKHKNKKNTLKEKTKTKNLLISKINLIKMTRKKMKDDFHNILEENICNTCKQEIHKEHKEKLKKDLKIHLEKLKEEKERKKEELKNLNESIQNLEKEIEELEEKRKEKIKCEANLNSLNTKKEENKKILFELKKLNKEIEELEKVVDKNFSKKEEVNKKKELKELDKILIEKREEKNKIDLLISNLKSKKLLKLNLEKEVFILKKEIEEKKKVSFNVKETLNELSQIKDEKLKLSEKIEKIESNLKKVNLNIEKLIKVISNLQYEIKNFTSEIETSKKNEKQIEIENLNLEKLIKDENFLLKEFFNILSELERTFFLKYLEEFSNEFKQIFFNFLEDRDFDTRIDSDFEIKLEQNGFDTSTKNLSGGEQSSLALSYRLGLRNIIDKNIFLDKLNFLILDEPTEGFSKEQMIIFSKVLKNLNLKQTILVSHNDTIESISDKIFKVQKINHVSKIT